MDLMNRISFGRSESNVCTKSEMIFSKSQNEIQYNATLRRHIIVRTGTKDILLLRKVDKYIYISSFVCAGRVRVVRISRYDSRTKRCGARVEIDSRRQLSETYPPSRTFLANRCDVWFEQRENRLFRIPIEKSTNLAVTVCFSCENNGRFQIRSFEHYYKFVRLYNITVYIG